MHRSIIIYNTKYTLFPVDVNAAAKKLNKIFYNINNNIINKDI